MSIEIENIKVILKGIDKTETESCDGWWETTTGSEFGKQKLQELIEYLENNIDKDKI